MASGMIMNQVTLISFHFGIKIDVEAYRDEDFIKRRNNGNKTSLEIIWMVPTNYGYLFLFVNVLSS